MLFVANLSVVVCFLAALFFAIVPLLPSWIFILLADVLYGLIRGFHHLTWVIWTISALVIIALVLIDLFASQLGTKRVGGSKWAVIGAAIGAIIGPFLLTPLLGIFIGPALGAMLGQLTQLRKVNEFGQVAKVGLASLISQVAATLFKIFIITFEAIVFFVSVH